MGVMMKVNAVKFLNSAQNLVLGKKESGPATGNEVSQNSTTIGLQLPNDEDSTAMLPDAEQVIKFDENQQAGVGPAGCALPEFIPYTQTLPWHSAPRNLFSRFFPRYGNYCGPNWSSGRESGSLVWDKKPIDWLDHCCYCHDKGYDSYNQADLYNADVEFLNCLQNIPEVERKNLPGAYRNLYILGLQRFLIPYRQLVLKRSTEKGSKQFQDLSHNPMQALDQNISKIESDRTAS
ncbi:unnamed protein product [Sphagnum compactum]